MKSENKKLYEAIMSSVAKEVKKALNESRGSKYVFSSKELKELKNIILNDEDFYNAYCEYGNVEYYDSYNDAIDDFMNFLDYDVFPGDAEGNKHAHEFYILTEPDLGFSYVQLSTGKIANMDHLWTEFKSIISQK